MVEYNTVNAKLSNSQLNKLKSAVNSASFKYKASLLGKATDADGNDRSLENTKIVVPLKYLSNFFKVTRNAFN